MMIRDHFVKYLLLCSLLICANRGDATGICARPCSRVMLDRNGGVCNFGFVQKELCVTLYLLQSYAGPTQNEVFVLVPNPVGPPPANGYGNTYVDDWEVVDGLGQNAQLVARAIGLHFQSSWFTQQWYSSHSIVFEEASGWNGSSLEVRGPLYNGLSPFEWAIVGGTGEFAFAQGILSGKILSETANTRTMKISIQALYRPMM